MQDLKAIRFIKGTKISHDYDGKEVKTFSYRDLWQRNIECIGIACKQSGILVVDVDVAGATHKHDGTEFWANFCRENGIPATYTVRTPSGGYHFYFKLPSWVNPDLFFPPDELALGVDVKYRGWVAAPPSVGYIPVEGCTLANIEELPASLIEYMKNKSAGAPAATFDVTHPNKTIHRPFSPAQIIELRKKIEWVQVNGTLSRDEWRDGLFALKAGIDDHALLMEFAQMWSMNKAYQAGDEEQAFSIVDKADKHGPVGPGTIFAILNQVQIREGAPVLETPYTIQEILDRAKVPVAFDNKGNLKIEASESNVSSIIGAIYEKKDLFFNSRLGVYSYQGKHYSDEDLANILVPKIQNPHSGLGLEKVKRISIRNGLEVLGSQRQVDPHHEYLKSLSWDGVERIEKFFSFYVGAEDSEYIRLVSKKFWVAMAARGLIPGCQFDHVVVIEGWEGLHKSSLIRAIGGEYTYAPSQKDAFTHLDCLRQMHQSIIVELPELVGLKGENADNVKAFVTKPFDTIRDLFAKRALRKERSFVLVGTTNDDKYLPPDMGKRRFWPVRIPGRENNINIAGIKADRDQLFAEAVHWLTQGYEYWRIKPEILDPHVSLRIIQEPLKAPVKELIGTIGSTFTTLQIYSRLEQLGFISKGYTPSTIKRIENAIMSLGYEEKTESDDTFWTKEEEEVEAPKIDTSWMSQFTPQAMNFF